MLIIEGKLNIFLSGTRLKLKRIESEGFRTNLKVKIRRIAALDGIIIGRSRIITRRRTVGSPQLMPLRSVLRQPQLMPLRSVLRQPDRAPFNVRGRRTMFATYLPSPNRAIARGTTSNIIFSRIQNPINPVVDSPQPGPSGLQNCTLAIPTSPISFGSLRYSPDDVVPTSFDSDDSE